MPEAFDWGRVYTDFPVNSNLIWLNNCGTTPISKPVLQAVTNWLEAYSQRGSLAEGYGYAMVKSSIYRRLEALLNAQPGEIVLTHNTAEGMNFVSHGLSLESGSEILILENEYPSNVYPWEHWLEQGVHLKIIPIKSDSAHFLTDFMSVLTKRTKVAALSSVHWCTGMPIPLMEIGKLCRERGIALICDGSQGVGMVNLDVKAQGITAMAFSAWKWLLGPVGVGALYIDQSKLSDIRPIFKGTESVINDQEYLPYKEILKPNAERFQYSTGNMNDWIYFDASLAYLDSIGFSRVRSRILELAAYLSERLREIGFDVLSDTFGAETGIVATSKPGLNSTQAVKELKTRKIIAAERLGRIRFSPHIYNSPAQLDRVVAELASLQ